MFVCVATRLPFYFFGVPVASLGILLRLFGIPLEHVGLSRWIASLHLLKIEHYFPSKAACAQDPDAQNSSPDRQDSRKTRKPAARNWYDESVDKLPQTNCILLLSRMASVSDNRAVCKTLFMLLSMLLAQQVKHR